MARCARRHVLAALFSAAALAACSDPPGMIAGFPTAGGAAVFVFVDIDDNGSFAFGTDRRLIGGSVVLRRVSTARDSTIAQTDTAGIAVIGPTSVGTYRISIPPSVLGDSLEMFSGATPFTIPFRDTISFTVGLRFRSATVAEARALPVGSRIWVKGIVLNGWSTYGDSTIHIERDGVAMRLARAPATSVVPGDTARFFGTRITRDGQPSLNVDRVIFEVEADLPVPVPVTTAAAASAAGGSLDAALVRVSNVTVTDTARTAFGDRLLNVTDGSGAVTVFLTRNVNFDPPSAYVPGMVLDATGVLVPDPSTAGRWLLKPRGRFDIVVRSTP